MSRRKPQRVFASLVGGTLVAGGLILSVAADKSDGPLGYRAPGTFDRQQAELDRQALVDRLTREMPQAARDARIRIDVSEAERAQIAGSQEPRLRVGIVKSLGAPIRFRDQDAAAAQADHGGRTVGSVERAPGGGFVWAATIESPEATALRVHFTGMDLAPSAELFIYSGNEAFGPYTGRGIDGSGELWSHTILGDRVTVQLRQGKDAGRPSSFDIADLGYMDLRQIPRPFPQASNLCSANADCVENAACSSIPQVIQDAKFAVAHMEFVSGGFLYFCSGGLVATAPATSTPYFLTANHCIHRSSEASSLQNYFQYDDTCNSPTCPLDSSPGYFYNGNTSYPASLRTVGATIRATSKTGDFTLLELTPPIPALSAFLGWNKTAVANTNNASLFRISHPQGAPQAYSTHSVDTGATTCRSWPRGSWIYSRDTFGATEGGSSGSPVLNASGQIVGQLSGGCGFNVNDVCDSASNATVDGAFASYFCSVQPFLAPGDTSCGGGGGGGGCGAPGASCKKNSDCCPGTTCSGQGANKTCG